jgi:ceramide glucosyltransferase
LRRKRQRRWARLRRAGFPLCFAPEILSGAFAPLMAVLFVAWRLDVMLAGSAPAFAMLWYGAEMLLR